MNLETTHPSTMEKPTLSVIIPTYNRQESLRKTLKSLENQELEDDAFEVIVIDDGSSDGTKNIQEHEFNLKLHNILQANQGDAEARNTGANAAWGDFLVFLDDDVRVEPGYLNGLLEEYRAAPGQIVMGLCIELVDPPLTPFQLIMTDPHGKLEAVLQPSFDRLCSNNMGLSKEAYFAIGGMQSLGFPGSDMWCDVDFAYRAHLDGYEFRRNPASVCYHKDHNLENRNKYMGRVKRAAAQAVLLFLKYPDLQPQITMFRDMTPTAVGREPFTLSARKALRIFTATSPVLWGLQRCATLCENSLPNPALLRPLYRWITGAYIFRGYRQGLRDYSSRQVK